MYLFHETSPTTSITDVLAVRHDICEHWAEGTYAVFVAHQFRAWPVFWENWTGDAGNTPAQSATLG